MSLMVPNSPSMEIVVRYEVEPNGDIKYYEDAVADNPNIKEEKFSFRKPSWADMRIMMSAATKIDSSGKTFVEPWTFIDIRIKTLMCDWSIKDSNGKKIGITADTIDKLHPSLLSYLNERLDKMEASEA